MKTLSIDLDVYNYLVARGLGQGQTATEILRVAFRRTIEVDDEMYAYILSLADESGESASSILRRELGLGADGSGGSQPPAPAPEILEFRIPAGTVGAPWNTRETMVVGRVGQTLRIHNDDAVPHRLHTPGQPFPHPGSDIPPGAAAEFVLQTSFDPGMTAVPPIYDHAFGTAAAFWLRVTE